MRGYPQKRATASSVSEAFRGRLLKAARSIRDAARRLPERRAHLILFFLSLTIRLLYLNDLRAHDPFFDFPIVDSEVYHRWALEIAGGDLFGKDVFFLAPGYAYFLALIYRLFGAGVYSVYLIQAVLDSFSVLMISRIGKKCFGGAVGPLAGLFWAFYGPAVFYNGKIAAETLGIFLMLSSALLTLRFMERKALALSFFAGLVLGAACLAKSYWLILIPLWTACLLIWGPGPRGRRMLAAAVLCLGLMLPIGSVTIRNLAVTGQWVLISGNSGLIFYSGNNPRARGVHARIEGVSLNVREQWRDSKRLAEKALGMTLTRGQADAYWRNRALRFIRDHPLQYASLLGKKLVAALTGEERSTMYSFEFERRFTPFIRLCFLSFYLLMPLGLTGILLDGDPRRYWPLYGIAAAHLFVLLIFMMESRYRLPAVPILCLFSAYAILHAGRRILNRPFALCLLVVLMGFSAVQYTRHSLGGRHWPAGLYFNLGNAYLHRGDTRAALRTYETAHAMRPDFPELLTNMGKAHLLLGHCGKAVGYWIQAHRLKPRDPLPVYNLAKTHEGKDEMKAKMYWRIYLELAGELPSERPYVEEAKRYLAEHP